MSLITSENAREMQTKSVESKRRKKAIKSELLKNGNEALSLLLNQNVDVSGLVIDSDVLKDCYKDVLLMQLKHRHNVEMEMLRDELDELKSTAETMSTSNVKTLTEPTNIWQAIDEGLIVLTDDDKMRMRLWAQ
ncbi:hypothetical protein AB4262_04420 [Vibrio breoganii]|uniref:hypothetical protein n=1 Tax=Vibrio breoganii TaxID=553239 RepID=UPI000C862CDD|nr:hypothetical protein [Vibrio breoganii]PML41720.1 hypothetical protein BCT78_17455 [Vibrio breoganii]